MAGWITHEYINPHGNPFWCYWEDSDGKQCGCESSSHFKVEERDEMQTKPIRVQRKRTKGWKMPPNTVCVNRGTKWGNPFTVKEYGRRLALFNYRQRFRNLMLIDAIDISELSGKNLACFCRLDEECHADFLLEIANV